MRIFINIYVLLVLTVPIGQKMLAQGAVLAAGEMKMIKAQVTNAAGQPVSGILTYAAVTAPRYELRTAVSGADGTVSYVVPKLSGKGQVVLQFNDRKESNLMFRTSADFIENYCAGIPPYDYTYPDTSMFYGIPDKAYVLDDYTRFATLEEVFREFVEEVKLVHQGNNFKLTVLNKPYKIFFDNEPLILLDGVPVFDQNQLMDLDPLNIRSIDVVSRKYYLGNLLCYGIISLFSFDGDMAGYKLPARATVREFGK